MYDRLSAVADSLDIVANQNTHSIDGLCKEQSELYSLWIRKAEGKAMPMLSDLSQEELHAYGDAITTLKVIDTGYDFKYLNHAPSLIAKTGVDMTGRSMWDWSEEIRRYALHLFPPAAQTKTPYFLRHPQLVISKGRPIDRIALPLSDDGNSVSHLLVHVRLRNRGFISDTTIRPLL